MPFELTDKEARKVQANRKTNKPSYFDAGLGVNVEISQDFEDLLIILPASAKQQITQALAQKANASTRANKRDGLLFEALTVDQTNADEAVKELDSVLSENEQVQAVFDDSRLQAVQEVGMIKNDIQSKLEESFVRRSRTFQDLVVAKLQADAINNQNVTEEAQQQQVDSWNNVINEYRQT